MLYRYFRNYKVLKFWIIGCFVYLFIQFYVDLINDYFSFLDMFNVMGNVGIQIEKSYFIFEKYSMLERNSG